MLKLLCYYAIDDELKVGNTITPGPWFNIKMSAYQYRKSHCGDKTVVRSSYLHNGDSYIGKITSLYWIRAQVPTRLFGLLNYPIFIIMQRCLIMTTTEKKTYYMLSHYFACDRSNIFVLLSSYNGNMNRTSKHWALFMFKSWNNGRQ